MLLKLKLNAIKVLLFYNSCAFSKMPTKPSKFTFYPILEPIMFYRVIITVAGEYSLDHMDNESTQVSPCEYALCDESMFGFKKADILYERLWLPQPLIGIFGQLWRNWYDPKPLIWHSNEHLTRETFFKFTKNSPTWMSSPQIGPIANYRLLLNNWKSFKAPWWFGHAQHFLRNYILIKGLYEFDFGVQVLKKFWPKPQPDLPNRSKKRLRLFRAMYHMHIPQAFVTNIYTLWLDEVEIIRPPYGHTHVRFTLYMGARPDQTVWQNNLRTTFTSVLGDIFQDFSIIFDKLYTLRIRSSLLYDPKTLIVPAKPPILRKNPQTRFEKKWTVKRVK